MAEVIGRITDEKTGSDGVHPSGTINVTRYMEAVRQGRVSEVQTRSDFTWMADLIDRGVAAGYLNEAVVTTFEQTGRRRDTADLAGAHGGEGKDYRIHAPRVIPVVAEKGEYRPIDAADESYSFRTYKFGCQWDISWEAYLRDDRDLSLLMDYPQSWGLSMRYTQQYVYTAAYAGDTTFFSVGHGNYGTAALDEDALDEGLTALASQTDPSGNIIPYSGRIILEVPPALERTARQLLNATFTLGTGTAVLANLVNSTCDLLVNPFLPAVDTTHGDTTWYLFCDPAIRPAMRYGYLRGYDQPQLFVKAAETQALFGGAEDPFDGSFGTDDIEFKMRGTFGADQMDYRGAYMSIGTT